MQVHRDAAQDTRQLSPHVWASAVVVCGGIAAVFLMVLGREQWFFLDEFDFLVDRSARFADDLLRPHNEHLSILPVLEYRAVFASVGMRVYWPYYAVLVVAHLVTVGLSALVMRRSGVSDFVNLPASAALAVQAVGSQNTLWAFQTGFIGSVAFFLGAVLLITGTLTHRRQVLIALLLIGSLACSGVGLSACTGIALGLLARRASRRALAVCLAPPLVAYGFWYVTYGAAAESPSSGLTALQTADRAPLFVVRAAAHSLGGLVTGDRGVGDGLGLILVAGLLVLATVVLARTGSLGAVPTACLGMAWRSSAARHWSAWGWIPSWRVPGATPTRAPYS